MRRQHIIDVRPPQVMMDRRPGLVRGAARLFGEGCTIGVGCGCSALFLLVTLGLLFALVGTCARLG